MIAVVVVRDETLPSGADETVAECGGRVLLACSGLEVDHDRLGRLTAPLEGVATEVRVVALGEVAPGRWAAALAALLADESCVVLPSSPDGRDLAPRLAAELRRPLYAGAIEVSPQRVSVARNGGSELHDLAPAASFVATLQPGVRSVIPDEGRQITMTILDAPSPGRDICDAQVVEVLPPDPASIDLSEAERIVAGGAGLDDRSRMEQLGRVGALLGASVGATRVVTDRGWIEHSRQIGTTGVVVDPSLYLAFGVSGAVQHTSGLGDPDRIISVNVDANCPMMQLADLAVVADANDTLDHLERLLTERSTRG